MSSLRSLIGSVILIALLNVVLLGQTFINNQANKIAWGVSFSKPQSEYLGVDWRQNYIALLDDMEVRNLRLMSYWNQIESADDQFDFTDLDWQMDRAAERGARVSVAIGARQPRWPECHIPEWVSPADDNFETELSEYLIVVANRYQDHPALASWQLENEASNRLFGECEGLEFDKQRLEREITTLKQITPDTPIYNSTGNQSGIPLADSGSDGFAFSIYDNAYFEALGREWKWNFWYLPPLWHSARARAIELTQDKLVFIHELQLEPWGATGLAELGSEQQNESMSPEIMDDQLDYVRRTGFDTVYLWGSEWWYQQKQQGNDQPWRVASLVFER